MKTILTMAEFKGKGLLEEGCWFSLKLDESVDTKLGIEFTGAKNVQFVANLEDETHFFRYTKELDEGKDITLLGEPSRPILILGGITGSQNAIEIIDTFCNLKYSVLDAVKARTISMAEQERLPDKLRYGEYWLPEIFLKTCQDVEILGVRTWENGIIDKSFLVLDDESLGDRARSVRPVISIKEADVKILVDKKSSGKSKNEAYEILVQGYVPKKTESVINSDEKKVVTTEELIALGIIKEGYWFKLHLNPKVETELKRTITGYAKPQEIKNKNGETWLFRYVVDLNSKPDELNLLGEPLDCDLYLSGKRGYEVGKNAIDSLCKVKFGFYGKIYARSITWDEQAILSLLFQYGQYWLPEKFKKGKYLGMQYISEGEVSYVCLYIEENKQKNEKSASGCDCNGVRPVISLYGKNVKIIIGRDNNGMTPETAFEIVAEEA